MKIVLLKDHGKNKAGEEIEVDEARGNYLIRMGVAQYAGATIVLGGQVMKVVTDSPNDGEVQFNNGLITLNDNDIKEKQELEPAKEKQEYSDLPTKKKRGRKPKQG